MSTRDSEDAIFISVNYGIFETPEWAEERYADVIQSEEEPHELGLADEASGLSEPMVLLGHRSDTEMLPAR